MVDGKPRQSVQVNEAKEWIVLPPGDDVGVDQSIGDIRWLLHQHVFNRFV